MTQGFLNNTSCSLAIHLALDQAPTTSWRPLDARPGLNVDEQAYCVRNCDSVGGRGQFCFIYQILFFKVQANEASSTWKAGLKGRKSTKDEPQFPLDSNCSLPTQDYDENKFPKIHFQKGSAKGHPPHARAGNTEAAALRTPGCSPARGPALECGVQVQQRKVL